ncbi:MAG: PIG-L family deacetylase [Clostridia bacterium]|nr:PIG-L family deacetylase [Clostridia bacterium]
MRRRMRVVPVAVALLAVLCTGAAAREEGTARNVTGQCRFVFENTGGKRENIKDGRVKSHVTVATRDAKSELSVRWKDKTEVAAFYLQWEEEPSACEREWRAADGTVVLRETVPAHPERNEWIPVPEGARELVLSAKEPMTIAECGAYSAGERPKGVNIPAPTPEKLDFLVVSTHPDDDQLFMGAVLPVYGAERGYTGSVLFMTCRERRRYEEALNGVRVAGLETLPLFLNKKDGGPEYKDVRKFWDFDETVAQLARCFRQYRPEVVVTHDLMGEYGQALHRITAEAVTEAVLRAAEPEFDPASAGVFGAWQVKKLYLHLYPENRLHIDMRAPLAAFGGRNALEVATAAYKEHKSQQYLWFTVSDRDAYSAAEYGLAFTAVGPDTPGVNDMFEHVGNGEN